MTFPVLDDPEALNAERMDARAFPTTLVLDRDGLVLGRFNGPAEPEEIEEAISRAR